MIILLNKHIPQTSFEKIIDKLQNFDYEVINSTIQKIILINSEIDTYPDHIFTAMPGVEKIIRTKIRIPKILQDNKSAVEIKNYHNLKIPQDLKPTIIAGPCAIESEEQIVSLALKLKNLGVNFLRGGAFKPRTSPYDFQGLGITGLKYIKTASLKTNLPIVSEIMSTQQLESGYEYIDIFQVGARNMYNYELLKELGRQKKPVLLKRSFSATIDEFLQSAEYLYANGNNNVILCERGIRSFETQTRNTLDLNCVAYLKNNFNLPVLVDPSHGTGLSSLVKPMSQASIACGADGLIIEVHETPQNSISDSNQAINISQLEEIISIINPIYSVIHADRINNNSVMNTNSQTVTIK